MRIRPEDPSWHSIQRWRDGGLSEKSVEKHLLELAPRAEFVRSYKQRGGRDSNGQRLDPVLAFHLGLSGDEPMGRG